MNASWFFYSGLTFITIHEMDAVRCKEWRIFPGLSLLNDKWGQLIFMLAHIPLFYFVFWKLFQGPDTVLFINGFNVFLVAHLFLHILYLKHKMNEFKDWISWTFIGGAGLSGMADLLVRMTP